MPISSIDPAAGPGASLTVIRYRVRPDRAAENERAVAEVFEELRRAAPPGVRYASLRLEDGVSFVHLVAGDGQRGGTSGLTSLAAFQAFAAGVKERIDEGPVSQKARLVGAYRFFADER